MFKKWADYQKQMSIPKSSVDQAIPTINKLAETYGNMLKVLPVFMGTLTYEYHCCLSHRDLSKVELIRDQINAYSSTSHLLYDSMCESCWSFLL